MALVHLADWLDEQSRPDVLWYAKRLSANDTLANKAHQAGPYVPRDVLFRVFPSLRQPAVLNPRVEVDLVIDSHPDRRTVNAIWYNNKLHGGTRDETRLTGFGGGQSPLLDPDSTGSLAVFVFSSGTREQTGSCHVWLCEHETEDALVEERLGSIEPGEWRVWPPESFDDLFPRTDRLRRGCRLEPKEIPAAWLERFPTAQEIINKTIEMRPDHEANPDVRLLRRRACEYDIFQSVEEAVELPTIKRGFDTVDEFLGRAQTLLQRRKARAGLSLERHIRAIFIEEGLREGTHFSFQPRSEGERSPDFLFPSESAYKNSSFSDANLRMLAVKTTCKDRWRQILNEAARIGSKHLLTLQEGVSENQFREMTEARVKLVVPQGLAMSYPASIRSELQSLESFIGDIRLLPITKN